MTYWIVFTIVAAGVILGPAICNRLENRADQRDRDLWLRQPGATR